MKPFYTFVFRKSGREWIALCLENGIVGQGATKAEAARKLKQAIESFNEVLDSESDVYHAPISIRELHEFLTFDQARPSSVSYELRAVYA